MRSDFINMNFLAHAFLSFNDPDILTGNMISDFVKGKQKFDFPLTAICTYNKQDLSKHFTTDEIEEIKKNHNPVWE